MLRVREDLVKQLELVNLLPDVFEAGLLRWFCFGGLILILVWGVAQLLVLL